MTNGNSASFRIDSKAFSLAFEGGRTDSYSINERRGKFHGSIRVGRLGLDWLIACLTELCRWDFSKQHFFKRFRENYKILELTSISNKGGMFAKISEYHNGAKRGCLRVPEGGKKGGWATLEKKLCAFFLGKSESMPGKEAVAGGGGFDNFTGNQRSRVWQKLNDCMNSGSDLLSGKQFPNLTSTLKQKEKSGGFDLQKLVKATGRRVKGRARLGQK
nr:hypothetical protein CFP56_75259 [Quercus suber]